MTVDAAIQNDKDADTARSEPAPANAAPVVVGDAVSASADPRPPLEFLGITLPGPLSRGIHYIDDKFQKARQKTITAAPNFVVNHSSNIVSATQIVGEVMMFQASAKEPLVKDYRNPISWVIDPPRIILSEIFRRTKGGTGLKEIFEGNPFKNFYNRLTDTKAATLRERALQRAARVGEVLVDNKISLPNRWQARSTFSGLMGWGLNMVMPDNKDTPEEVERMAELAEKSPASYVAERFRQAVWIPEWPQHKRQMTGLAVMISGICSTLGAWRNRSEVGFRGSKIFEYKFNPGYLMTALATFAASMPLLFRLDNDRGYANYGEIHLLRCFFLPPSIWKKYKEREPGVNWYTSGVSTFQLQNATAALIGGAEKRPDGTVVDHKAIREEAKRKAHLAKAEQPPSKHGFWREEVAETPQPRIQKGERSAVEHTPPVQAVANQKLYSQLHK